MYICICRIIADCRIRHLIKALYVWLAIDVCAHVFLCTCMCIYIYIRISVNRLMFNCFKPSFLVHTQIHVHTSGTQLHNTYRLLLAYVYIRMSMVDGCMCFRSMSKCLLTYIYIAIHAYIYNLYADITYIHICIHLCMYMF